MINVGIVGISGYSGGELLNILLSHSKVRVTYISANNTTGKLEDIWPQYAKRGAKLVCEKFDAQKAITKADLFFLAVPHTVAMQIAPLLLKNGKKVIDLSGDYRLKKASVYKKWYGQNHNDSANLKSAVYGLPELFKEDIKKAKLIANPGCYPTATILGLLPLVSTQSEVIENIIVDAKSGVSGAGKKAALALSYCEVNESIKAYKVFSHQHTPEIMNILSHIGLKSPDLNFVPHLLPVNRGILSTIYVRLNKKLTLNNIHKIYKRFYKTEPFVRMLAQGQQPELKHVTHNNFCDIGLALNTNKQLLVITSVIDNLIKGASGQAVQNMNLMCDYPEGEGLW